MTNEELPRTWSMTNIGSVAHVTKLAGFEYTKHIKLNDTGEIPVIRAQNVQMGRFVSENIKYITKQVSDYLVRSQTHGREILMVFIGACGNVCMAPKGRWHLGPNVAKIDASGVNNEYLYFYLQSPIGLANSLSWMKRTAQPSLSMGTIRKISLPLPPAAEQHKIVSFLSKVDELIQKIEQIIETIQRLKRGLTAKLLSKGIHHAEYKRVKSIFANYVEIPTEWDIVNFGQIMKDIRYGTSVKCTSDKDGTPILRIPNVVHGFVNSDDLKYARLSQQDIQRFGVMDHDIIFVRTNGNREYVGRCAVFHGTNYEYGIASYLIRVRADLNKLNPDFFTLQQSLPMMKNQVRNETKTSAGQYNINIEGLKSLKVVLPPLNIQLKINSIISRIENEINCYRAQKASIEALKKGLMQQLLTGKIRVKV